MFPIKGISHVPVSYLIIQESGQHTTTPGIISCGFAHGCDLFIYLVDSRELAGLSDFGLLVARVVLSRCSADEAIWGLAYSLERTAVGLCKPG